MESKEQKVKRVHQDRSCYDKAYTSKEDAIAIAYAMQVESTKVEFEDIMI